MFVVVVHLPLIGTTLGTIYKVKGCREIKDRNKVFTFLVYKPR